MSAVHNIKSRADDICDGALKGRGRCVDTVRSCFVLALFAGAFFSNNIVVGISGCFPGVVDPAKVICHEPSGSRASVADAKLQDQQMRL